MSAVRNNVLAPGMLYREVAFEVVVFGWKRSSDKRAAIHGPIGDSRWKHGIHTCDRPYYASISFHSIRRRMGLGMGMGR